MCSARTNAQVVNPTTNQGWDGALVNMAPSPVAVEHDHSSIISRRRNSKFFFVLLSDVVADQKKSVKVKRVRPINGELLSYSKKLSKPYTKLLKARSNEIRDFFVKELSPLTLASAIGAEEAKKVLKELTGVEMSEVPFNEFSVLMHRALALKFSLFIENYLGLPNKSLLRSLEDRTARRKASVSKKQPSPPEDNQSLRLGREMRSIKKQLKSFIEDMDTNYGRNTPKG